MIPPLVQIALLETMSSSGHASEKQDNAISFEDVHRYHGDPIQVTVDAEFSSEMDSFRGAEAADGARIGDQTNNQTETVVHRRSPAYAADQLSNMGGAGVKFEPLAESAEVDGISSSDSSQNMVLSYKASDGFQEEARAEHFNLEMSVDFSAETLRQIELPRDAIGLNLGGALKQSSAVSRGTMVEQTTETKALPNERVYREQNVEVDDVPSPVWGDISTKEKGLRQGEEPEAPNLADHARELSVRQPETRLPKRAGFEAAETKAALGQMEQNLPVERENGAEAQVRANTLNNDTEYKRVAEVTLPHAEPKLEHALKGNESAETFTAPKRVDESFISQASETPFSEDIRVSQQIALDPPLTVTKPVVPTPSAAAPKIVLTIPQVEEMVQVATTAGMDGQIEVELQPLDLGRMKLTFKQDQQGLTVIVEAEKPETVDQIKRHLEQVSSDLRSQGDVAPRFRFESGSFGQTAREGQNQQQQARKSRSKAFGDEGLETAAPAKRLTNSEVVSGNLDIRV